MSTSTSTASVVICLLLCLAAVAHAGRLYRPFPDEQCMQEYGWFYDFTVSGCTPVPCTLIGSNNYYKVDCPAEPPEIPAGMNAVYGSKSESTCDPIDFIYAALPHACLCYSELIGPSSAPYVKMNCTDAGVITLKTFEPSDNICINEATSTVTYTTTCAVDESFTNGYARAQCATVPVAEPFTAPTAAPTAAPTTAPTSAPSAGNTPSATPVKKSGASALVGSFALVVVALLI